MTNASSQRIGGHGSNRKPQRTRTTRRLFLEQLENRLAMDAAVGQVAFTGRTDYDIAHAGYDGFYLPPSLQSGEAVTLDLVSNDFFSPSYTGERKITGVKIGVGAGTSINFATLETLYTPWSGNVSISEDGRSVTLSGDYSRGSLHIYYTVDGTVTGEGCFDIAHHAPMSQFELPQNGSVQELDVLANQPSVSPNVGGVWQPGVGFEYSITSIEQPPEGYGQVTIIDDGKKILYTPPANPYAGIYAITFNYTLNSSEVQTAVVRLQGMDPSQLLPPEVIDSLPDDVHPAAVANVIAHAANVSSLAPSEFQIVYAKAVIWPDHSLGVPEPGYGYAPSIAEGYHLILEAGGERFDYHVGDFGRFILAERTDAASPLVVDDPPGVEDYAANVIAHAASLTGLSPEDFRVTLSKTAMWADSWTREGPGAKPTPTLETPGPFQCTVTFGYQIIIEGGGEQFDYHLDGSGYFVLASRTPLPETAVIDPAPESSKGEQFVPVVKEDAANLIGVSPSELNVVLVSQVTWSNGSLGAPRPGFFYTQALVEGYRIILEGAGKRFDYHLDGRGYFVLASLTLLPGPETSVEQPGDDVPSDPGSAGPSINDPAESQVESASPVPEPNPNETEATSPELSDADLAAIVLALTSPNKPTASSNVDESSTDSPSVPFAAAVDEFALALGGSYAGSGSQSLFREE